jgi:HEAT repeat protein
VALTNAFELLHCWPEAQATVPSLVRALKDKDSFIRDAAASALGRIGPAGKEAAPEFIALLEKQNRFASAAGPWASGAAGSGSRRSFDFRGAGRGKHLSFLQDYWEYRSGAYDPFASKQPGYPHDPAYVLSRIDAETRSAQPLLAEMAKDPVHPGRLAAALALWRSGGEAPDLLAAFTDALRAHAQASQQLRTRMNPELRQCLAELGTQLKPAAPVLTQWLALPRWRAEQDDVVAVAEALGYLGSDARAEGELLLPLLHGHRWDARRRMAIAQAYFRITGDADAVLPGLREVLFEPELRSRYARIEAGSSARVLAARGLGLLAENGDQRARALIVEAAKGDENPHVRVAALEALGRIKDTTGDALAGLEAVLRHSESDVRVAAVSALARLGDLPKSSRLALEAVQADPILAVRQAAKQALENGLFGTTQNH